MFPTARPVDRTQVRYVAGVVGSGVISSLVQQSDLNMMLSVTGSLRYGTLGEALRSFIWIGTPGRGS